MTTKYSIGINVIYLQQHSECKFKMIDNVIEMSRLLKQNNYLFSLNILGKAKLSKNLF